MWQSSTRPRSWFPLGFLLRHSVSWLTGFARQRWVVARSLTAGACPIRSVSLRAAFPCSAARSAPFAVPTMGIHRPALKRCRMIGGRLIGQLHARQATRQSPNPLLGTFCQGGGRRCLKFFADEFLHHGQLAGLAGESFDLSQLALQPMHLFRGEQNLSQDFEVVYSNVPTIFIRRRVGTGRTASRPR